MGKQYEKYSIIFCYRAPSEPPDQPCAILAGLYDGNDECRSTASAKLQPSRTY